MSNELMGGEFLTRLEMILENQNMKVLNKVGEISKKVDVLDERYSLHEERLDYLENEEEVTTAQKRNLHSAVTKQVYGVLGLPLKKRDWTLEDKVISQKYSSLFFGRCYAETARKGHLASPYEETTKRNYADAIKDIEAWTPSNGIEALKKEADDNALARKIAQEQGYK